MNSVTIRYGETRHIMGSAWGLLGTYEKPFLAKGDGFLDGPVQAAAETCYHPGFSLHSRELPGFIRTGKWF